MNNLSTTAKQVAMVWVCVVKRRWWDEKCIE